MDFHAMLRWAHDASAEYGALYLRTGLIEQRTCAIQAAFLARALRAGFGLPQPTNIVPWAETDEAQEDAE